MDAEHEYVWAVYSPVPTMAVELFASKDAADEHIRRRGVAGYTVIQTRIWETSYLSVGAYLRPAREIHITELH